MFTFLKPRSCCTSLSSPDRNARPQSDSTSEGTPCRLTIPDQEICNGGSRLVCNRVHFRSLRRPLRQVVDEDHSVLVAMVRQRKLNNVESHPIKWSSNRNGSQRSTNCSSRGVRVTYQTSASPLSDVTPHPTPPVVASEFTMHFHITQVGSEYSPMGVVKEPSGLWVESPAVFCRSRPCKEHHPRGCTVN